MIRDDICKFGKRKVFRNKSTPGKEGRGGRENTSGKGSEKFKTGNDDKEMNKTFAEAFKGNWDICGVRNNRVDCEYRVVKKN